MEVRWILATLFTTTLLAFPLGLQKNTIPAMHHGHPLKAAASTPAGRTSSGGSSHRKHSLHRSTPLHEAVASWYGPSSGTSLACGGELASSTVGVANKTLRCGTRVRVCLNRSGPCINVTVVDRGPYVEGREYDLTEATARRIGFMARGVGPVWVSVG